MGRLFWEEASVQLVNLPPSSASFLPPLTPFDLCCLFVFVVLPVILGLKQNKLLIQDPEGNSW